MLSTDACTIKTIKSVEFKYDMRFQESSLKISFNDNRNKDKIFNIVMGDTINKNLDYDRVQYNAILHKVEEYLGMSIEEYTHGEVYFVK